MKTVILFGSTGMLGRYVHDVLTKEHSVKIVPRDMRPCDMKHTDLIELCKGSEYIVNCVAAIPQRQPIENIEAYIRVNTKFPLTLEKISMQLGSKLIHITTDYVFDGRDGNYDENSKHSELSIYGVSKSLGEPDNACVIRTNIVGESEHGKGLLEWVRQTPKTNMPFKQIDGYKNHHWNGVTCLQLAKYIAELIRTDGCWKGVRHYYGDDITKYQLVDKIAKVYGLPIIVEIANTERGINRTLRSIYKFPLPPSIDVMLKEQKNYSFGSDKT